VGGRWRAQRGPHDPADAVAVVALAKRALLLHLNRHRLRLEDLEDCYSQAVVELIAHVRAGGAFRDHRHVGCALELRFDSRVRDRRRALAGRSPAQAALESSVPLADGDDGFPLVDARADVERVVIAREELRRLGDAARALTRDQRLALAAELGPLALSTADFCASTGWTADKYRKVTQRARARLAILAGRAERTVPRTRRASVEVSGTAYDHRTLDP
jgi:hypothetical protein